MKRKNRGAKKFLYLVATPLAPMSLLHLSVSLRTNSLNSPGVLLVATIPSLKSGPISVGSAAAFLMEA